MYVCDPTLACATGRRAHSAWAEAGGEAQWHLHVPQQCRAPASCDGSAVYAESDQQANAEAEAEEGGVHEADMAEPEGAEPTAEEYNAFFDAIMAMP